MEPQAEIAARLARYAVTTDARDLWPDVGVSVFRAAQTEIGRVTSAVLAGAGEAALRLPPGMEPRALGVAAFAAGMGPLLGFWCETGRATAQPEVASLLATHLDHGRRRAVRLGAALDRIIAAFADRGIETLVLKGAHTSRVYFPEPGTRPTADVDLLVRGEDRAAAAAALRDLGFAEDPALVVKGRSHWVPADAGSIRSLELTHADDPWSVDLHTSLDRPLLPGVTVTLGPVTPSSGVAWHGLSRPARVLAQPLLLAHLAVHTSAHFSSMPLVRLVELVLVARQDFAGSTDRWRTFHDLVGRTGAGRCVFPALDLAARLAPGAFDPATLERVAAAAPRRLRRYVRTLEPGSAQRLHPIPFGQRFLWPSSPRELLASALDFAWPRTEGRLVSPSQALVSHARRLRRLFFGITRARSGL